MTPKRKRGGQPGNQNARTHGFYSRTLTPAQQASLSDAAGLDGLDQEIALLRLKIASVVANDPQNIRVLVLALSSLARLLRAKQLLDRYGRQRLQEAFSNVMRDIAAPLGLLPRGISTAPPETVSPSLTKNESCST